MNRGFHAFSTLRHHCSRRARHASYIGGTLMYDRKRGAHSAQHSSAVGAAPSPRSCRLSCAVLCFVVPLVSIQQEQGAEPARGERRTADAAQRSCLDVTNDPAAALLDYDVCLCMEICAVLFFNST
eukprot:6176620-Pleurochrysis_carterae.AAC.2